MSVLLCKMWREDAGQDMAEYAVMLGVILLVIGSNANTAFSSAASSIR
jgi:Flp pilus assembly pilin Flp